MTFLIVFSPEARADLSSIFSYYDAVAPHVVYNLEQDIDRVIEQLRSFPDSYQSCSDTIRRAHFRIFPYTLYYHIRNEAVEVIAILAQQASAHNLDERILH